MRHGNQGLIYICILAFAAIVILPYLFNPVEPFSPAKCIQKVIDFCQKLSTLEQELSSILKRDVYQELIQKDLEPAEDLIIKENHEIQMYLLEFSPSDMLILRDYEDSAESVFNILTTIPKQIKSAKELKLSQRSELENKKLQLLQDFPSFQAEISNLEELGIYLNVQDSKGKSTEKSSEIVTGISGLEILLQIKGYFEDLEKYNEKIKVFGKHYTPPDSADQIKGTRIEPIIDEINKTERKLRETVYKGQSILRHVYPNSEASIIRIQEYVSVLEHKDNFWHNEWIQRLADLKKQYNMFRTSINQLKLSYQERMLRQGVTKT